MLDFFMIYGKSTNIKFLSTYLEYYNKRVKVDLQKLIKLPDTQKMHQTPKSFKIHISLI